MLHFKLIGFQLGHHNFRVKGILCTSEGYDIYFILSKCFCFHEINQNGAQRYGKFFEVSDSDFDIGFFLSSNKVNQAIYRLIFLRIVNS
ncbi:hypothetical protein D3C86_1344110 [compost metagenome]